MITYLEVIGKHYPEISCTSVDMGEVYENIVHTGGPALPDKATLDVLMLEDVKIEMWGKIQEERDRRANGGVKVGDNWYHSDQPSRILQLGLVVMGAGLPPGIMWKTMSGSFIEMTQTLAVQIFQKVAYSDTAIFSIAEQHKAQMRASATPETYNCLTATPAWPITYGEE